jgi:hypothetical protein
MKTKDFVTYLESQFPSYRFAPNYLDADATGLSIGVFATGGDPDDELPIEESSFQILIRAEQNNFDQGEDVGFEFIRHFDKRVAFTVGDRHVFASSAVQSQPIPLVMDEKNHPRFSVNFEFITRPL